MDTNVARGPTPLTVYPDGDGVVVRWKRGDQRVILKLAGIAETAAAREAIPLLVETLALLRAIEPDTLTTIA